MDEYLRFLAQQDATQQFFNRGPDPEPGPTIGQRIRGLGSVLGEQTLGRILTLITADPSRPETREAYGRALGVATDLTPGAGDIKALTHDAPTLFAEGRPVWGTVAAASAIPFFGLPFDVLRKLRPGLQAGEELAEGAQRITVRHYGRGALEDLLDPSFAGTGPAAGRETARTGRQPATHFYIPGLRTGPQPMPEHQLVGQPYVDVEIDASQFLNPEGFRDYIRRAEELVNRFDRAAVASKAEELAVADGAEGLIVPESGVMIRWTKTDLRPAHRAAQIADHYNDPDALGSTFVRGRNMAGENTHSVAIRPGDDMVIQDDLTEEVLERFEKEYADDLAKEGHGIGTWTRKTKNGEETVIDVVEMVEDAERAVRLGTERGQDGIYHLGRKEFIPTPPGAVAPPTPTTNVADLVQHARTTGTRAGAAFRAATRSQRAFDRTLEHIASVLPPDRAEILLNSNKVGQRNIIRAYTKGIDPATLAHAALAGRAARGWYTSSEQALRSTFGTDAPLFTAILAASSPNVPVPKNVTAALDIYGDWIRAGRPTDEAAIRAIAKDRQPGLADFTDNMVRVMQADPADLARTDNVLLSGPKVEPFRKNLLGDPNFVTQDVHTGRLMGGGASGVTSRGLAGEAKHIEAARLLSEWTGAEVTPSEVQEMSWSFIRALNEAGGKEDPVSTLTRLFENGGLTSDIPLRGDMTLAEWIGDHHSIGTLLHQPENAKRLAALGRGVPREIKPSGFRAGEGVEIDPRALFEAAERYRRSKAGKGLFSTGALLGVRSASQRLREERERKTPRRF